MLAKVYRNERQYFWLRQSLHFFGGVIVGILSNFFYGFWVTYAFFGALMGVIIWKEIREDKVSQPRYKTVTDCISWALGFWIVAWTKFV